MLLDCNFLSYIVAALACSMKTPLEKNAARLAVQSVGIGILFIASFGTSTHLDLANAQQNKTLIQTNAIEEKNKALVLKAFDTLFNQRDYVAAERYWSPKYIQHSAHIEPGREGLFNLVKSNPPTLKYEPGTIVADGDFVIVHGRFSGFGQPVNWIAADILHIKDGVMVEHWDVIQDEVTQEQSKSGLPMFGDKFPNTSGTTK
jgi:predicted SnoaL-like aldol condensation-catalyzing enzyme